MRSGDFESALINAALIAVSILFALLLSEATLRFLDFSYPSFWRPDDQLGMRLRANAEGWQRSEGEAFVRINSAGFRDRERSLVKPPGVFRIAVLGDSMIEALHVDLEETFSAQLERRLNVCGAFGGRKVEVLNFGVSGYGTAQQLLTYRHFGSKYSPDLVLSAFFAGNDVRNNSKSIEVEKVRPFFTLDGERLVEDSSFSTSPEFLRRTSRLRFYLERMRVLRVMQAAYFIKDRITVRAIMPARPTVGQGDEAGIDDAVYREPTSTEWREAWALTERLYAQLRDEVNASGARLIILSLASGIQVHPDPSVRAAFMRAKAINDIFYPNQRIEEVANRLRVQSVPLGPIFQETAEREKSFFHGFSNTRLGTGHWNGAGNRMAAEVAARALCGNAAALGSGN